MKRNKVSQTDLARHVGRSQSCISDLVRCENTSLDLLKAVSVATGLSIEELAAGLTADVATDIRPMRIEHSETAAAGVQ